MTNKEKLNKMSCEDFYNVLNLNYCCPPPYQKEVDCNKSWRECKECWLTWLNDNAEDCT